MGCVGSRAAVQGNLERCYGIRMHDDGRLSIDPTCGASKRVRQELRQSDVHFTSAEMYQLLERWEEFNDQPYHERLWAFLTTCGDICGAGAAELEVTEKICSQLRHDEPISFAMSLLLLSTLMRGSVEDQLTYIFCTLDADVTWYLRQRDLEELVALFVKTDDSSEDAVFRKTERMIAQLLAVLDPNDEGRVHYNEWIGNADFVAQCIGLRDGTCYRPNKLEVGMMGNSIKREPSSGKVRDHIRKKGSYSRQESSQSAVSVGDGAAPRTMVPQRPSISRKISRKVSEARAFLRRVTASSAASVDAHPQLHVPDGAHGLHGTLQQGSIQGAGDSAADIGTFTFGDAESEGSPLASPTGPIRRGDTAARASIHSIVKPAAHPQEASSSPQGKHVRVADGPADNDHTDTAADARRHSFAVDAFSPHRVRLNSLSATGSAPTHRSRSRSVPSPHEMGSGKAGESPVVSPSQRASRVGSLRANRTSLPQDAATRRVRVPSVGGGLGAGVVPPGGSGGALASPPNRSGGGVRGFIQVVCAVMNNKKMSPTHGPRDPNEGQTFAIDSMCVLPRRQSIDAAPAGLRRTRTMKSIHRSKKKLQQQHSNHNHAGMDPAHMSYAYNSGDGGVVSPPPAPAISGKEALLSSVPELESIFSQAATSPGSLRKAKSMRSLLRGGKSKRHMRAEGGGDAASDCHGTPPPADLLLKQCSVGTTPSLPCGVNTSDCGGSDSMERATPPHSLPTSGALGSASPLTGAPLSQQDAMSQSMSFYNIDMVTGVGAHHASASQFSPGDRVSASRHAQRGIKSVFMRAFANSRSGDDGGGSPALLGAAPDDAVGNETHSLADDTHSCVSSRVSIVSPASVGDRLIPPRSVPLAVSRRHSSETVAAECPWITEIIQDVTSCLATSFVAGALAALSVTAVDPVPRLITSPAPGSPMSACCRRWSRDSHASGPSVVSPQAHRGTLRGRHRRTSRGDILVSARAAERERERARSNTRGSAGARVSGVTAAAAAAASGGSPAFAYHRIDALASASMSALATRVSSVDVAASPADVLESSLSSSLPHDARPRQPAHRPPQPASNTPADSKGVTLENSFDSPSQTHIGAAKRQLMANSFDSPPAMFCPEPIVNWDSFSKPPAAAAPVRAEATNTAANADAANGVAEDEVVAAAAASGAEAHARQAAGRSESAVSTSANGGTGNSPGVSSEDTPSERRDPGGDDAGAAPPVQVDVPAPSAAAAATAGAAAGAPPQLNIPPPPSPGFSDLPREFSATPPPLPPSPPCTELSAPPGGAGAMPPRTPHDADVTAAGRRTSAVSTACPVPPLSALLQQAPPAALEQKVAVLRGTAAAPTDCDADTTADPHAPRRASKITVDLVSNASLVDSGRAHAHLNGSGGCSPKAAPPAEDAITPTRGAVPAPRATWSA